MMGVKDVVYVVCITDDNASFHDAPRQSLSSIFSRFPITSLVTVVAANAVAVKELPKTMPETGIHVRGENHG